jgi:CRISPR-associated protein Cas1
MIQDGNTAEPTDEGQREQALLPARMINEFVYCPRLFWLEHVAGEFMDNEHTLRGQHTHRRVDRPGGRIDAPSADSAADLEGDNVSVEAEPPTETQWYARGLWLSDDAIGVTAKLDLVEQVTDDTVRPVDTKNGKAPDSGLWPADDVQLTLQGLLLRAKGYRVDDVSAWYAGSRRRVTVPLTDERAAWAREMVGQARETTAMELAPEPLVDSPKCYGCSLAPICQPDEVNLLTGHGDDGEAGQAEVRRLVLPHEDAMPLIVQSTGARIGLSKESLVVYPSPNDDWKKQEVGLGTVSQVMVFGNVQVTTQALHKCLGADIPVHFFSSGGWYHGGFAGHSSRWPLARQSQYAIAAGAQAVLVARDIIGDKIANQRTLLRRNFNDDETDVHEEVLNRLKYSVAFARDQDSAASLLGVEGDAARWYWPAFWALVGRDDTRWASERRSRRPPGDPVNAMLSFGYAMLVKDCTRATQAAGLDPYVGIFHTIHHGRPSLALDLMEPFRPLVVESMVLRMIRLKEVSYEDFLFMGQEVRMKPHARKRVVEAYERRMAELITHPVFGYRVSYRQAVMIQARLLARVFTGELDRWPSFRTR